MLIEVKAVGIDLRDGHAKQAVDYAANQGVEWVALTNGVIFVDTIRRELRRVSEVKVEPAELRTLLKDEVIKREVLEGEKADAAHKKVSKSAGKMLRIRKDDEEVPAPVRPVAVHGEPPKRVEEV